MLQHHEKQYQQEELTLVKGVDLSTCHKFTVNWMHLDLLTVKQIRLQSMSVHTVKILESFAKVYSQELLESVTCLFFNSNRSEYV